MIILMINCEIYLGVGTPIYIIKAPKEKKKIKNLSCIPPRDSYTAKRQGGVGKSSSAFS